MIGLPLPATWFQKIAAVPSRPGSPAPVYEFEDGDILPIRRPR